ncbi:hypothetical protein Vadar_008970 [Vaccinium darrowii]|uniref:Uncharacterized protein n=1 Tax=Vaccinium darrowii TaxID=229202 RepID=A0ACB7XG85_9ERIC|nr:hypothetical protein Vadar_008970 [Vaccinium darrowii]
MAETDFLDLDEGTGESVEIDNLCLVGKILHHKTLNPTAVSTILQNAWKTRANFSIASWNNIFLFHFEDAVDRSEILSF